MPRVSEIIKWFQKAIDADMENRKFQSLWEALEEVQDDVEGGNLALAAFGRLYKSWHAITLHMIISLVGKDYITTRLALVSLVALVVMLVLT